MMFFLTRDHRLNNKKSSDRNGLPLSQFELLVRKAPETKYQRKMPTLFISFQKLIIRLYYQRHYILVSQNGEKSN